MEYACDTLFDITDIEVDKKKRRNWEDAFQRWSNRMALNDPYTFFGKCGHSEICDFCKDNTFGRPCVRALNAMCREKGITIDYNERNFEKVW